jgi:hypothetical protein
MATTKRETTSRPRSARAATAQIIEDAYRPIDDAVVLKYPILGALMNIATVAVGVYSAIHIAAYIGVAALIMSGSAFLGMLVALLASLVGIIQALQAGAYIGRYMSTGQFTVDWHNAKSTVRGWFTRKEVSHV